jgi:predicted RNA binding protein YcfA (HicA-like mRNA interferase family)
MDKDLKLCSGAEVVQKLQRAGWSAVRQKGSHVMMTKPGYQWTLSIPQHQELGPGILRKLIRQAGLTIEELNNL